jgi:hypothetical protein
MSRKMVVWVVLLLLVVPMALVACGDDDDDGDNGGAMQSFEASTGIAVEYPEDWAAAEQTDAGMTLVVIANSQEVVDKAIDTMSDDNPLESGAVGMFIFPPQPMAGQSFDEYMQASAEAMAFDMDTTPELEKASFGDYDGYRFAMPDDETDGMYMGIEIDGQVILAAGVAASGELDQYEDTLVDIFGSVSYSAPADDAADDAGDDS